MITQDTLFDANALLTTLHHNGMEGFAEMLNDEPDTYNNVEVLVAVIMLLKNAVDLTLVLTETVGLNLSFSDVLKFNGELITTYNDSDEEDS